MQTFVVETEETAYLGHIDIVGKSLRVRTGLAGHPAMLDLEDIVRIIPADEHPDVVETAVGNGSVHVAGLEPARDSL